MNKLLLTITLVACLLPTALAAQTHNSVPLEDSVYFLLEAASIRGYCNLPSVRPYSLEMTLRILDQILAHPAPSPLEREAALAAYRRLSPEPQKAWHQTGRIQFNYDSNGGPKNRIGLGSSLSGHVGSNFATPSLTYEAILDIWVNGDFTKYFSYKLLVGAGLSDYAFDAYPPYTFSQPYDGFQFLLSPMGRFTAKSQEAHIGLRIMPELSLGFADGMLSLNFSRIRRDWQLGAGAGGLLLTGSARPFMAADLYFAPVQWMSLAFLTGVLEYNKADQDPATNTLKPFGFQSSISLSKLQFHLGKWVDISVNSAVVFPKRFELGYMNPLTIPLFYQNTIGDFDNLYLGGTLVVNVPEWGRLYVDALASELRSLDLFYTPQNVYAWQAGAQGTIPGLPAIITLQYTKLEPFMYTHYGTLTPWNGDIEMDTSLINHGEGVGSNLLPNSDELKLEARIMPLWFLEASASYRMVRHGITPPGSTYEPTQYADMPDRKHFLHDGVYQWQHIFTLGCQYDMQGLEIPLQIFCDLGLVYSYFTNADGNPDQNQRIGIIKIDTSEYPTQLQVMGRIGFKLYP